MIRPPAPLLPAPTVMLIAPPLPPYAEPDPMETEPDVPELDVPVLKIRAPLPPAAPAFGVLTLTWPLEVPRPCPLVTVTIPPVHAVA